MQNESRLQKVIKSIKSLPGSAKDALIDSVFDVLDDTKNKFQTVFSRQNIINSMLPRPLAMGANKLLDYFKKDSSVSPRPADIAPPRPDDIQPELIDDPDVVDPDDVDLSELVEAVEEGFDETNENLIKILKNFDESDSNSIEDVSSTSDEINSNLDSLAELIEVVEESKSDSLAELVSIDEETSEATAEVIDISSETLDITTQSYDVLTELLEVNGQEIKILERIESNTRLNELHAREAELEKKHQDKMMMEQLLRISGRGGKTGPNGVNGSGEDDELGVTEGILGTLAAKALIDKVKEKFQARAAAKAAAKAGLQGGSAAGAQVAGSATKSLFGSLKDKIKAIGPALKSGPAPLKFLGLGAAALGGAAALNGATPHAAPSTAGAPKPVVPPIAPVKLQDIDSPTNSKSGFQPKPYTANVDPTSTKMSNVFGQKLGSSMSTVNQSPTNFAPKNIGGVSFSNTIAPSAVTGATFNNTTVPSDPNAVKNAATNAVGTPSASKWASAKNIAGKAMGVPLTVAIGAYEANEVSKNESLTTDEKTVEYSKIGGKSVGALAGGAKGAAMGGVVGGPIGAVVGSIVGGLVGYFVGEQAGEIVGDVINAVNPSETEVKIDGATIHENNIHESIPERLPGEPKPKRPPFEEDEVGTLYNAEPNNTVLAELESVNAHYNQDSIMVTYDNAQLERITSKAVENISPMSSINVSNIMNPDIGSIEPGQTKTNLLQSLTHQLEQTNAEKETLASTPTVIPIPINNSTNGGGGNSNNGSSESQRPQRMNVPNVRNQDGTLQRLLDLNYQPLMS